MPVIPALGSQGQEDGSKLEASLMRIEFRLAWAIKCDIVLKKKRKKFTFTWLLICHVKRFGDIEGVLKSRYLSWSNEV